MFGVDLIEIIHRFLLVVSIAPDMIFRWQNLSNLIYFAWFNIRHIIHIFIVESEIYQYPMINQFSETAGWNTVVPVKKNHFHILLSR